MGGAEPGLPWQRPGLTLPEQIACFCEHFRLDERCYTRLAAVDVASSQRVVGQQHWADTDNVNRA
eukprot:4675273-Alexandrium_andersonii.AAC.1